MLTDGVTVEYRAADGSIRGAQVHVIDFDQPLNNDWLVVNQFAVVENHHSRRPDVVLFVNGLPLVLIELKNPSDEKADIWKPYQQLQTYRAELPTLFSFNEMLVISDGLEARLGVLDAGREWFKPWRTISGEDFYPPLPSPSGRVAGGEGLPSPAEALKPPSHYPSSPTLLPKGEGSILPGDENLPSPKGLIITHNLKHVQGCA